MGSSSVVRNTGSLWDAIMEFKDLEDTILEVKDALLLHSEKELLESDIVKDLLMFVEDVLYRGGDLADEIFPMAMQRRNIMWTKKVRFFFSTPLKPLIYRRRLSLVIKEMRTLYWISKFVLGEGEGEGEGEWEGDELRHFRQGEFGGIMGEKKKKAPSCVPKELIGREAEVESIIAELLKDHIQEESILVIPIVGIAGLGKTALAQFIFNDKKVQQHFELKIWVSVSDVFDFKEIVEKIIVSITKNYPENGLALHKLQDILRQRIQGKHYLLILDGVCDGLTNIWPDLRNLLSGGSNGSRIIVTTRSSDTVAKIIDGGKLSFNLDSLNEDDSWSLFMKMAFAPGQQPTDTISMDIARKIVKGCRGIPMLIRTIGRRMSDIEEVKWQSFYDNKLTKVLQNEDGVSACLRLSYDNLSPPLKNCVVFCGLFPKDYEFEVATLITMWISQGFIVRPPHLQQSLEDLGYANFLDLLSRSFFHDTDENDTSENITKCKMQTLMHDLARSVAGNAYATFHLNDKDIFDEPRHISFHFHFDSSQKIPLPLARLKRIRTLILPRQFESDFERKSNKPIWNGFIELKLLRMLDLHNSGIQFLPSSIGELVHLRYLDLSQNVNMKTLPNSISRLRNLQTLKVNHCSNLQTLPRGITKLVRLRNLENESCYCLTHMPRGLSRLVNLRTVSEFVLSNGTDLVSNKSGKLDELKELDHLRGQLKIKNLKFPKGDKTVEARLLKKLQLSSLILIWDIDDAVSPVDCEKSLEDLQPHSNLKKLSLSAYVGFQFPNWLSVLTNLVELSLLNCINCQCLPQLDCFPRLRVLVMDKLTNLEYISNKQIRNESLTCLPSLRELRLTDLPKLESWWNDASDTNEEMTVFPLLSKLIVEDCPNLTSMPLFPFLEELLVLKNTSWKPFQRTISALKRSPSTTEIEVSSSSSSKFSAFAPLSALETLHILHMPNGEPNMWQALRSLRSLMFHHIVDINYLLEGLDQVTSLQKLHIWHCDSLKEIPNWISNPVSLKTISIKACPNLTIRPDRMSFITSLKVEIEDCPGVSYIETMLKDQLYTR
ncbi:putative disease resistance protein RGA3 [Humulus lupulus]|uniref:putative disease resistance protein RGA3 n=1 Tax=Humulus lupulus TaxID=3486 RepID=UPI002B407B59|nr:putative disease resistance protein RGA3 [Humulus lupulus]XP_062115437.1 putative disease resistance protein RGA3 [Humulus lupulus]